MAFLNWWHQQDGQLAVLLEEVKAWEGAEVRVWYFSCGHDRFVLRLARGDVGRREFSFLDFMECDPIAVSNLDRLTDVRITASPEEGWRLMAAGISIDFRICNFGEVSAEVLQEFSGIAPPILLDEKSGIASIPRMAPLLKGGGHYGYRDEQNRD